MDILNSLRYSIQNRVSLTTATISQDLLVTFHFKSPSNVMHYVSSFATFYINTRLLTHKSHIKCYVENRINNTGHLLSQGCRPPDCSAPLRRTSAEQRRETGSKPPLGWRVGLARIREPHLVRVYFVAVFRRRARRTHGGHDAFARVVATGFATHGRIYDENKETS